MSEEDLKQVYKKDDLVITFNPHLSGPFYNIQMKPSLRGKDLRFVVEETTMEDLCNVRDMETLSKRIRIIDNVFYSALSRRDIERIYNAIQQVRKDYEKGLELFRANSKIAC